MKTNVQQSSVQIEIQLIFIIRVLVSSWDRDIYRRFQAGVLVINLTFQPPEELEPEIWGVKWFTPPLATIMPKEENREKQETTGGRLQLKCSIRAFLNGPLCGII